MKQAMGWWWPDHEEHLLEWMRNPKTAHVINDRQAYQGIKQLAVVRHCKHFRTAVDVGAHVGLWSYNLAHWFQNVVAFEPVEDHRECWRRNLADAENVTLYPVALGAVEGTVDIAVTKGSSGDSKVSGKGSILLKRLDSYKLQDVDLIKIDCEGYEENVLMGAVGTINYCRPVIIVEQKRDMATRFGLKPKGAVDFLRKLKYRQAEEIGGDHIMVPLAYDFSRFLSRPPL